MPIPPDSSRCGSPNRSASRNSFRQRGTEPGAAASNSVMGLIDSARLDAAAVLDIAHRYDDAAEQVDGALQRCHTALAFTGARAGREYSDGGTEVRRAVDHTVEALRGWARSCREIAAQLRVSAEDYAQIDDRAARRIG